MLEINPVGGFPLDSLAKSGFPLLICISFFMHTNFLSSCILIWYRFTNERHCSTIETIDLPRLAREVT